MKNSTKRKKHLYNDVQVIDLHVISTSAILLILFRNIWADLTADNEVLFQNSAFCYT